MPYRNPAIDSFGRQRISAPFAIFDSKLVGDHLAVEVVKFLWQ